MPNIIHTMVHLLHQIHSSLLKGPVKFCQDSFKEPQHGADNKLGMSEEPGDGMICTVSQGKIARLKIGRDESGFVQSFQDEYSKEESQDTGRAKSIEGY